jgi:hypothetical protein
MQGALPEEPVKLTTRPQLRTQCCGARMRRVLSVSRVSMDRRVGEVPFDPHPASVLASAAPRSSQSTHLARAKLVIAPAESNHTRHLRARTSGARSRTEGAPPGASARLGCGRATAPLEALRCDPQPGTLAANDPMMTKNAARINTDGSYESRPIRIARRLAGLTGTQPRPARGVRRCLNPSSSAEDGPCSSPAHGCAPPPRAPAT